VTRSDSEGESWVTKKKAVLELRWRSWQGWPKRAIMTLHFSLLTRTCLQELLLPIPCYELSK
jgi:hypothetical protein